MATYAVALGMGEAVGLGGGAVWIRKTHNHRSSKGARGGGAWRRWTSRWTRCWTSWQTRCTGRIISARMRKESDSRQCIAWGGQTLDKQQRGKLGDKAKKWRTRWTKTGNREAEMVAKFKLVKLTIIFLRRLLVPTFDKWACRPLLIARPIL